MIEFTLTRQEMLEHARRRHYTDMAVNRITGWSDQQFEAIAEAVLDVLTVKPAVNHDDLLDEIVADALEISVDDLLDN